MKKAGIVGGMGPESTLVYYHDIVYGVQEALGDEEYFPPLSIESVNVFDVLRLCGQRDYEGLADYLAGALERLAAAGADFAALSANTPHIVFDRLREGSPLPLVSIIEAARDEALRRDLKRIGLLGTVFTMNGEFFKKPFVDAGIDVVVPTAEEKELIGGRIASELERGIVRAETLAEFQDIIGRMRRDDGIEAVALGCTELPLLLSDEVSPVPCLDTLKIHVAAIVSRIIEKEQK